MQIANFNREIEHFVTSLVLFFDSKFEVTFEKISTASKFGKLLVFFFINYNLEILTYAFVLLCYCCAAAVAIYLLYIYFWLM